GARLGVDATEQIELAREVGIDRLLGQGVQIVRPAAAWKRERSRGPAPVRDGARLPRGFLEVLDRDLVGVGVASTGSGLGANPGPLAHVARGLFDNSLFEYELFVDTVLEVDVGVVHLAEKVATENALHEPGRDAESVREKGLGSSAGEFCHRSIGLPGCRSANPNVRSPTPQAFRFEVSYGSILPARGRWRGAASA